MAAPVATRLAANTILSGPAAGVTAGASIAAEIGLGNVVCCDMGGTSFDVCIIQNGRPAISQEKNLGFGVPLCLPMLDVDAIGAGGGSLAKFDSSGILKVGPESAGADPGPACAGRGGTEPTVTDASLVLGYLDPDEAIGRTEGVQLDVELARRAIGDKIATPLAMTVEEAAEAVLTITGTTMAGHVRRNLLGRGLDPRDFSVIAFGGAGPVHVNRILRELECASAVVPTFPGLTSALGCILGRLRHDFINTTNISLSDLDTAALQAVFDEELTKGRALMRGQGVADDCIATVLAADMCYQGQTHVIQVTFPDDRPLTAETIATAFEAAYRERYVNVLTGTDIRIISARVTMTSAAEVPSISALNRIAPEVRPAATPTRMYFGGEWRDAVKMRRAELPEGYTLEGPALLTQVDSTTVIEPGFRAVVHRTGNLSVEEVE